MFPWDGNFGNCYQTTALRVFQQVTLKDDHPIKGIEMMTFDGSVTEISVRK